MGLKDFVKRTLPSPARRTLLGAAASLREFGTRQATQSRLDDLALPARTNKPRVVFQVEFFDKGGLEEVVFSLVRQFVKRNTYEPIVIVSHGEGGTMADQCTALGVPVIVLNHNRRFLKGLLTRLQPDLVNLQYSVFGADLYRDRHIPIVYSVQNNYLWADPDFVAERRPVYLTFDRIFACSRQVKEFFCKRFDLPSDRVTVVNNGLDLETIQNPIPQRRTDYGLSADDFVFVNVASFNWHKFHILMICAMERLRATHPNVRVVFVANVTDEGAAHYVREQIAARGLKDHVILVDFLPRPVLSGFLRECDCYLMPSVIEGWSMAIMDAMMAELPLILSDVGSARDVIENEDIGLIVPNPYADLSRLSYAEFAERYKGDQHLDNLEALCEAMVRMVNEAAAWREKGKQGRVKVETRFTAGAMADQYANAFDALLGKPS